MPSGFAAFYDNKIRSALELAFPVFQQKSCGPVSRHDRCEKSPFSSSLRKGQRQSGAADHRIDSSANRFPDHDRELRCRHHGVYRDQSASSCDFPRFADLLPQCPNIGDKRIFPEIRLTKPDIRSGDDSHSALRSHSSGESSHGDPDSHASLNYRD